MQKCSSTATISAKNINVLESVLDEITNLVGNISDMNIQIATTTEEQSNVIKNINENVVYINNAGNHSIQKGREAIEKNLKMFDIICEAIKEIKMFTFKNKLLHKLMVAKIAHLSWSARLRSFLNGTPCLNMKQAVSHHDCDFGKWYYSEGKDKFKNLEEFVSLEQPHTKLHKYVREIIELKEENNIEKAEKIYLEVEKISHEILAGLDKIINKISEN